MAKISSSGEADTISPSNCPKCGAPTGTGFFCDACGAPMFGNDDVPRSEGVPTQPTAPPPDPSLMHGAPSQDYVFPGDARAAAQSFPPGAGQMPPPGYPLPPGTVAYRTMPRPAPQGLIVSRKAVIIGISGFLLLILATIGVVLLLKPAPSPQINVPPPTGMEDVTGLFRDIEEDSIQGGLADGRLDAYYMDNDSFDILVAFSFDSSDYLSVPPQDATLEEMDAWVAENRDSIEKDLLGEFANMLEIDSSRVDLNELSAVQTASGDVAVHAEMYTYDQKTRSPAGLNMLIFSKSDTMYMVMLLVLSGGTGEGTMDFLVENITFE